MTSVDITVLPTDEVCRLLGIEERRLKQLIRDRALIEARDGSGARGVPQDVEAVAWLYTVQDELGERPIDALTSGRHHRVNRIASTLAF